MMMAERLKLHVSPRGGHAFLQPASEVAASRLISARAFPEALEQGLRVGRWAGGEAMLVHDIWSRVQCDDVAAAMSHTAAASAPASANQISWACAHAHTDASFPRGGKIE